MEKSFQKVLNIFYPLFGKKIKVKMAHFTRLSITTLCKENIQRAKAFARHALKSPTVLACMGICKGSFRAILMVQATELKRF